MEELKLNFHLQTHWRGLIGFLKQETPVKVFYLAVGTRIDGWQTVTRTHETALFEGAWGNLPFCVAMSRDDIRIAIPTGLAKKFYAELKRLQAA